MNLLEVILKFQELTDIATREQKLLPISYLIAMYSKCELMEFENIANNDIETLKNSKTINTDFQQFKYKAYLESQVVLIRRAWKHLEGKHEQQFRTLEGGIQMFDLCEN